ncbi:MAG: hypothetical protein C0507_14845 [Cyanobacteria bacterium PR.3.49]|nr:hypothetical protein [Cyanobacteria bacterium PR.3.49]
MVQCFGDFLQKNCKKSERKADKQFATPLSAFNPQFPRRLNPRPSPPPRRPPPSPPPKRPPPSPPPKRPPPSPPPKRPPPLTAPAA